MLTMAGEGPELPGQLVLVLQGGGALGAYQVGVFQALHESGLEPDWVIGTSIGAINGAIIAGNPPDQRMLRLETFWNHVRNAGEFELPSPWPGLGHLFTSFATVTQGVPKFFTPRSPAWGGLNAPLGVDAASYYSTEPLRETLSELVDFGYLNAPQEPMRLTVGAVNVRDGTMHYFDSRDEALCIEHVMASGALPPAFPAIRVAGEPYWDGGLYSNTPLEAVLDDYPRKDSVIFMVNVWQQSGPEPESIWQVMGRQKDIQYASRTESHLAKQKQIHHLRHIVRELARQVPEDQRASPEFSELTSWGCHTTMHVVRMLAPRLDGEDYTKDIDFTAAGIGARRDAGYAETRRMIERSPWRAPVDPMQGVIVHEG
ncbi:MAG TPA: patatin-like phospholipase family protein [Burkholderiales bacterium]|nr:patatin-like phospholipase family protein [Burkholderiales bacterium]